MIYKIPFKKIMLPDEGCHIMCNATLSGYKLNLLIDTGASLTVMDIHRFRQVCNGISIKPYHQPFTGIGSTNVETFFAIIDEFFLGELALQNQKIVLLNIDSINKAYAQFDLDRIDGILGGDLLCRLNACIDYGNNTVTIRTEAPEK